MQTFPLLFSFISVLSDINIMTTVQNCSLLPKHCFICRVNVLSPSKCKLNVNKLICFHFRHLSSHALYLSFLSLPRGSYVGHSCVSDAFLSQLTMNLTR